MSEELVGVKSFGQVWEAHFAQNALEDAGIESYLAGEHVWTTAPFAADPTGVTLQVRAEDEDRAKDVLANLKPQKSDTY